MASIFKPPKITQEQLSSTLLEYGEIVYNTTKNEFFTGNGTTGGITLFNEKPTKTSELINDSGFITSSQIDFSDYYTKEEILPKPEDKYQNFVHMCDYIASRRFLNVEFDSNDNI